jgi:DUF2950 family protein
MIAKGDHSKNWARIKRWNELMLHEPHIQLSGLRRIQAPVLISGADEDVFKAEHLLDIYRNPQHAQLSISPGTTHFLIQGQYERFNAMAERFLRSPFPRPTAKQEIEQLGLRDSYNHKSDGSNWGDVFHEHRTRTQLEVPTASIDSSSRGEQEAILQPGRALFAPGRNAQGPKRKLSFFHCCEEVVLTNLKVRRCRPSKAGTGRACSCSVKLGNQWTFDARASRQELLYSRIESNELDAIDVCRGYVEAQHEYALQKREGYDINQYAQRIVSTPGKQDGLAWQNSDGSWGGPIGEKVARAIEQGYSVSAEPYHGYFFKILKSQGLAAPLGEMDFVVKGVMIGGFALVAAPAEYGVTGVKSFIVSPTALSTKRISGRPPSMNL